MLQDATADDEEEEEENKKLLDDLYSDLMDFVNKEETTKPAAKNPRNGVNMKRRPGMDKYRGFYDPRYDYENLNYDENLSATHSREAVCLIVGYHWETSDLFFFYCFIGAEVNRRESCHNYCWTNGYRQNHSDSVVCVGCVCQ